MDLWITETPEGFAAYTLYYTQEEWTKSLVAVGDSP